MFIGFLLLLAVWMMSVSIQESLLFGNCDTCQGNGNISVWYCCKSQQKCCPNDKYGYCPPEKKCIGTGFLHIPTWCAFDYHCPGTQKCCDSLLSKCCMESQLTGSLSGLLTGYGNTVTAKPNSGFFNPASYVPQTNPFGNLATNFPGVNGAGQVLGLLNPMRYFGGRN